MVTALFERFCLLAVIFFFSSVPLSSPAAEVAEPRYPLSQKELEISREELQASIRQGEWLEAKIQYQTLLQYDLSDEDRRALRGELDDLNLKILFSPVETPDSFTYTVKAGDSLYKIAQKHNTTVELIKRSNHLENDLIRPGMSLKISKSVYSIVVNKTENKLMLYADGALLKMYPVATGMGDRTPIGSYTIENKLVDPVWYRAGAVLPPESPENILGTRWLGFSLPGYGIHGTTVPETIGQHVTEGCVRMYNRDVEELSAIVPFKTKVTIVE